MIHRIQINARGAVQGVGFRPFVYRLAASLGLKGWVANTGFGVTIELEGGLAGLEEFQRRLPCELPPQASIQGLEQAALDPVGYETFEIRESRDAADVSAFLLPDIATCADCLRELFDPADRRHRYPFINCTNCGPRYTIVESLPYDRQNTTMRRFSLCAHCEAEYRDPENRRFHAEPNACAECGPRLAFRGPLESHGEEALAAAVGALRQGLILAIKGVGGFHLFVDARDENAVRRLRERKRREEKPLAIMTPGLPAARGLCILSPLEERLLASPEAPIVILRRRASGVAPSVAPRNPCLGVMLPYAPLHHLLMRELDFPCVATSGNITDEPICADEREALGRLDGIADAFLSHDRPIARGVDDSIVRVIAGRPMILRRARGHAPLPIALKKSLPPSLAVGAQLKNTVAVGVGHNVFLSPHIGDLETPLALDSFRRTIESLRAMYRLTDHNTACDLHPDYESTRFARKRRGKSIPVQHHYAHALACLAENELEPPALAIVWDGTGYGEDGTVWGGEFLQIDPGEFRRVAHLRPFRLPGGDAAVKEPRRAALGVLYELFGEDVPEVLELAGPERRVMLQMLKRGVNSPVTTSAGRLFDAVAAIGGLRSRCRFEGQAAMELEYALDGSESEAHYEGAAVDWESTIRGVLSDRDRGVDIREISARFHNSLVEAMVGVARSAGLPNVILSGGCFQNARLTERAVQRLSQEGFRPYWHQRVPPNDGGIALGQIVALAR